MQVVTLSGVLGRDAEIRNTGRGDIVTEFSVAVSKGRDKPTTWWDCAIWGTRGEKLADFLAKGTKVTCVGTFSAREHEGRTYLKCEVREIDLHGGGSRRDANAQ